MKKVIKAQTNYVSSKKSCVAQFHLKQTDLQDRIRRGMYVKSAGQSLWIVKNVVFSTSGASYRCMVSAPN